MKSNYKHIIFALFFLLTACGQSKKTNWRVSFDRNKKDPYACYIAYHQLHSFFPTATIKSGSRMMKDVKKTMRESELKRKGHIIIMVCKRFEIDSSDFDLLKNYISNDNAVLIFSESFSEPVNQYFSVKNEDEIKLGNTIFSKDDSMPNQPIHLYFNDTLRQFSFTGKNISSTFSYDSVGNEDAIQVGYTDEIAHPNAFIKYNNNGALFINRAPISMTNYFLLQKGNREYMEYIFSFFDEYPNTVTWYSYPGVNDTESGEMDWSFLLRQTPLFFAFLFMMALLLIYVFFAAKRKQRIIPVVSKLENASLEFVETVGKLYYSKKGNKNLAEKMIRHYLENIRTAYSLKTNVLNDEFSFILAKKLDKKPEELQAFIAYLNYIRSSKEVIDNDIKHLYHQIKKYT